MTETIDQILGSSDAIDPAQLTALDEADRLDALARAVDPNNPDSGRALAILARSDFGSGGFLAGAIGQIVANPGGSGALATALSLAAAVGPEIVPVVLAALASSEDRLVGLAGWRTLQQVAGGDQLERIKAAASGTEGAVGEQAAFALSVIAYRAGVAGNELPVPSNEELLTVGEEETFSLSQSEVSEEDFEKLELLPSGELYLVNPTTASTSTIDCGENHMLLCLDSGVQESIPSLLLQGPTLAGVVAQLDSLGVGYSVRYLVMTWPDGEGGLNLALHHHDGGQAYYGYAGGEEISAEEVSINYFYALDRPGAERVALTLSASATGVSLGGDLLSAAEISGERLEPEAD